MPRRAAVGHELEFDRSKANAAFCLVRASVAYLREHKHRHHSGFPTRPSSRACICLLWPFFHAHVLCFSPPASPLPFPHARFRSISPPTTCSTPAPPPPRPASPATQRIPWHHSSPMASYASARPPAHLRLCNQTTTRARTQLVAFCLSALVEPPSLQHYSLCPVSRLPTSVVGCRFVTEPPTDRSRPLSRVVVLLRC